MEVGEELEVELAQRERRLELRKETWKGRLAQF